MHFQPTLFILVSPGTQRPSRTTEQQILASVQGHNRKFPFETGYFLVTEGFRKAPTHDERSNCFSKAKHVLCDSTLRMRIEPCPGPAAAMVHWPPRGTKGMQALVSGRVTAGRFTESSSGIPSHLHTLSHSCVTHTWWPET